MPNTPWDLLREGHVAEGLERARDAFVAQPNPSHTMELGVIYLWLEEYSSAWEHFQSIIRDYPNSISLYYSMAGAAKWCLGEADEAISAWRDGLDCDYADAGVNVRVPLLMMFAAVVRPDDALKHEMEDLLKERLADPRAQMWPGPLAEFMLGRIDEESLRRKCIDNHPDETLIRTDAADFYVGAIALGDGNRAAYMEAMTRVASLSWDAFDARRDAFLSRIWHPEFYLARHEVVTEKSIEP